MEGDAIRIALKRADEEIPLPVKMPARAHQHFSKQERRKQGAGKNDRKASLFIH